MSEKERKILDTFRRVIPDLSEGDKDRLLYFGEGMAFALEKQKQAGQDN